MALPITEFMSAMGRQRHTVRGFVVRERESINQTKKRVVEQTEAAHKTALAILANAPIDAITQELVSGFVAKWRTAESQVSSINRALQVLRRMRGSQLSGERQRRQHRASRYCLEN